MKRACLLLLLFFLWGGACLARDARPLLLQSPTLSKTQIAFAYGGDIWIADRNGVFFSRGAPGLRPLKGYGRSGRTACYGPQAGEGVASGGSTRMTRVR
jgi:hypothetical protein